ncbi:type II secretion system protein GspJ [Planctomycetota bacterium]
MVMSRKGFTLVELLVASMIGVFVAVLAVAALKTVSVGAQMVEESIETSSEIKFASNRIAADLRNIYRDTDQSKTKFVGIMEQGQTDENIHLIFYMVGRAKARSDQIEGDVYEVEYFLARNEDEDETLLMRRLWPNPDKEAEPGGILTVIAEDIEIFGVRFFDGMEWQMEWPEEANTMPEIVEVTIAAGKNLEDDMEEEEKSEISAESFIVNFGRARGTGEDS